MRGGLGSLRKLDSLFITGIRYDTATVFVLIVFRKVQEKPIMRIFVWCLTMLAVGGVVGAWYTNAEFAGTKERFEVSVGV